MLTFLVLIFVAGVVFSACSWTTGGDQNIVFPENNISFMHNVKPFLAQNCSYSPCHSGFDLAGGISLVEYHHIIAIGGFIVPKNPDGSRFVQVLENKTPHFTNFYRGNINENQIKGVRQWIKEGAINN
ncbi:hypothetical protein SDC9_201456 [bioreactor metagenome]|uniref:Cytochrome C Planctomycete-type domain-containing protein n=1 Tax=bioreactor metagenome TaxID=1076179 RepID=A0A645IS82_9ZZZZ